MDKRARKLMKAILVVDIPDDYTGSDISVNIYGKNNKLIHEIYTNKLRLLPQKKEIDIHHKLERWDDDCDMAHKCGYNCCLEDILYGEE